MQMFTVPQFIDVEDKIIGPITTRQFIICLFALGVLVLAWKLSSFGVFVVIGFFDFIIFFPLAFIKINGRPFHYFILNVIQTSKKPNLRIWNHKTFLKDLLSEEETGGQESQKVTKRVTTKLRPVTSHLKELSLIVDTKGVYKGGEGEDIV
jgi:hypothetical protein